MQLVVWSLDSDALFYSSLSHRYIFFKLKISLRILIESKKGETLTNNISEKYSIILKKYGWDISYFFGGARLKLGSCIIVPSLLSPSTIGAMWSGYISHLYPKSMPNAVTRVVASSGHDGRWTKVRWVWPAKATRASRERKKWGERKTEKRRLCQNIIAMHGCLRWEKSCLNSSVLRGVLGLLFWRRVGLSMW